MDLSIINEKVEQHRVQQSMDEERFVEELINELSKAYLRAEDMTQQVSVIQAPLPSRLYSYGTRLYIITLFLDMDYIFCIDFLIHIYLYVITWFYL